MKKGKLELIFTPLSVRIWCKNTMPRMRLSMPVEYLNHPSMLTDISQRKMAEPGAIQSGKAFSGGFLGDT